MSFASLAFRSCSAVGGMGVVGVTESIDRSSMLNNDLAVVQTDNEGRWEAVDDELAIDPSREDGSPLSDIVVGSAITGWDGDEEIFGFSGWDGEAIVG